jgi:hypothetical protein
LFGLIAGMLLSFVGIKIISAAYGSVMWSVAGAGLFDPIEFVLYLMLYMVLVVAVLTQSFKLINEFPNRILQWLGFQGQLGGNMDEAIGQSKQQFQGASQAADQGFKGAQQSATDKSRKDSNNKKVNDLQLAPAAAAAAGGSGAPAPSAPAAGGAPGSPEMQRNSRP